MAVNGARCTGEGYRARAGRGGPSHSRRPRPTTPYPRARPPAHPPRAPGRDPVSRAGGGSVAGMIGVDLGTTTVRIHVRGKGVVLREPAVIAVTKGTMDVKAGGEEAYRMLG